MQIENRSCIRIWRECYRRTEPAYRITRDLEEDRERANEWEPTKAYNRIVHIVILNKSATTQRDIRTMFQLFHSILYLRRIKIYSRGVGIKFMIIIVLCSRSVCFSKIIYYILASILLCFMHTLTRSMNISCSSCCVDGVRWVCISLVVCTTFCIGTT